MAIGGIILIERSSMEISTGRDTTSTSVSLSLSPFSNELSKFGAVIDITRSFRNKVFRLVRISNEPTRRATGTRKFA